MKIEIESNDNEHWTINVNGVYVGELKDSTVDLSAQSVASVLHFASRLIEIKQFEDGVEMVDYNEVLREQREAPMSAEEQTEAMQWFQLDFAAKIRATYDRPTPLLESFSRL